MRQLETGTERVRQKRRVREREKGKYRKREMIIKIKYISRKNDGPL